MAVNGGIENYFLSCRAASTDNSQEADLAVVLQSLYGIHIFGNGP